MWSGIWILRLTSSTVVRVDGDRPSRAGKAQRSRFRHATYETGRRANVTLRSAPAERRRGRRVPCAVLRLFMLDRGIEGAPERRRHWAVGLSRDSC